MDNPTLTQTGSVYCTFISNEPIDIEALQKFLFDDDQVKINYQKTEHRTGHHHTVVHFLQVK